MIRILHGGLLPLLLFLYKGLRLPGNRDVCPGREEGHNRQSRLPEDGIINLFFHSFFHTPQICSIGCEFFAVYALWLIQLGENRAFGKGGFIIVHGIYLLKGRIGVR